MRKPFLRQLVDDRLLVLMIFLVVIDMGIGEQIAVQTLGKCLQNGIPADPWDQGWCDVNITETTWETVTLIAAVVALAYPLIFREESESSV